MTDALEALAKQLRSVTIETKHIERAGYNEWCSKCVAQLALAALADRCSVAREDCRLIGHPETNGFLKKCGGHIAGDLSEKTFLEFQPAILKCKEHDQSDDECQDGCRLVAHLNRRVAEFPEQPAGGEAGCDCDIHFHGVAITGVCKCGHASHPAGECTSQPAREEGGQPA